MHLGCISAVHLGCISVPQVNDVFWIVRRAHAAALFNHLQLLSTWGRHEQARRRQRHQQPAAAQQQPPPTAADTVDPLCGVAPRLRAAPACTDSGRHASDAALTCTTGGHECMVSQALSAQAARWGPEHPLGALRVRYLPEMRSSPQVLRLADTDERFCAGMQLAYLCSEKRKVRRAPAAGALSGDTAAAAAMAAAFAERQKRCKQADRGRKDVRTRIDAIGRNRTAPRRQRPSGLVAN